MAERMIYSRHAGERWLQDSLDSAYDLVARHPVTQWLARNLLRVFLLCCKRKKSTPEPLISRKEEDIERGLENGVKKGDLEDIQVEHVDSERPPLLKESRSNDIVRMNPIVREKWRRAVELALVSRDSSSTTPKRRNFAHRDVPTMGLGPGGVMVMGNQSDPAANQQESDVGKIATGLRNLEFIQDLKAHGALVRHMEFTRDGRWLATGSWDRSTCIFKIADIVKPSDAVGGALEHIPHLQPHKKLVHLTGFALQVAWSDDGVYLLTKLTQSIKVWTLTGICKATVTRGRVIQTLAWLPEVKGAPSGMFNKAAVSKIWIDCQLQRSSLSRRLRDSSLWVLVCSLFPASLITLTQDVDGNVLSSFDFGRLSVLGVAVLPDRRRLLVVAKLTESEHGLTPVKAPPENRFIGKQSWLGLRNIILTLTVYNMESKRIETQVPVLNQVRDVKLACHDHGVALLSYDGHVRVTLSPVLPQLLIVLLRVFPNFGRLRP
jgi:WD40 repeat protein